MPTTQPGKLGVARTGLPFPALRLSGFPPCPADDRRTVAADRPLHAASRPNISTRVTVAERSCRIAAVRGHAATRYRRAGRALAADINRSLDVIRRWCSPPTPPREEGSITYGDKTRVISLTASSSTTCGSRSSRRPTPGSIATAGPGTGSRCAESFCTFDPSMPFSMYSSGRPPAAAAGQAAARTDANDWMTTDSEIACPDPNCPTRFTITRLGKRRFSHAETTAVPSSSQ